MAGARSCARSRRRGQRARARRRAAGRVMEQGTVQQLRRRASGPARCCAHYHDADPASASCRCANRPQTGPLVKRRSRGPPMLAIHLDMHHIVRRFASGRQDSSCAAKVRVSRRRRRQLHDPRPVLQLVGRLQQDGAVESDHARWRPTAAACCTTIADASSTSDARKATMMRFRQRVSTSSGSFGSLSPR